MSALRLLYFRYRTFVTENDLDTTGIPREGGALVLTNFFPRSLEDAIRLTYVPA
jgi:hypothetical protein